MSLLNIFLRLTKFILLLWLTASCVFLMSRLLPSANAPKGMEDADLSMHGATNAAILEQVRSDYLERTGLGKPLFYFDLALRGHALAGKLQATATDRPWAEKAVLWHGNREAESFYSIWQQWQLRAAESEKRTLLNHLLSWSISDSPTDRVVQEKEIANRLRASSLSVSSQLLTSWQKLRKTPSTLTNYLPVVQWHGSDNLYHDWMVKTLKGDLGASTQDYQAVSFKIKEAAGVSIIVGLVGLLFAMVVSYFMGLHFTENPSSVFTYLTQQFLYVLDSIPSFMIALFLLSIFLGAGGSIFNPFLVDDGSVLLDILGTPSILLGSLCISLLLIPHLTLQFHRSLVAQTQVLYQRTALAKGLTFKKTLRKHALPNALLPSITILSEVIIGLLAGVLVVEITFSLPGLGSLLAKSILSADYPVLVGLTLLFLIFRLLIVWLTELLYGWLDPRMRSN
ncbi:ABC transporter permease [Rufibacter sp. XAAS-G3-1]|uniref:ABC transporter permease n=1 Tax=Rufibacter sp. XAAS-G3-1 TaxID=2729134 RepID=UPI0015E757EA|nr:ABC transporter permease [Rufibacter sp. XAAS-G3-1]